ncbi:MAG TPA: hypothetical protein VG319_04535 [Polyangia bacterium]|jgi:hypothetical protein|nr:hypothetical protein [Polyangia bacterium]
MRALLCLTAFVLASGPVAARAETCPELPDSEVALRRSMAKEWFAKAEEAEAAADRASAIRRYACSLALAPHPSTAYNLGTVAEKSGDLSLALDGFRTYLKLAPEATDRPSVEARIIALDARIADLRQRIGPKTGAEEPARTGPGAPPVGAPAPPAANPASPVGTAPARESHLAAWITGAGALAALGGGLALNFMARSKMTTCFNQFDAGTAGALDRCDEAKPLAYGSYALFGIGGAAAVVSAALMLWAPGGATTEKAPTAFAPAFVPGGAAFVASGHF